MKSNDSIQSNNDNDDMTIDIHDDKNFNTINPKSKYNNKKSTNNERKITFPKLHSPFTYVRSRCQSRISF